MGRGGGGSDINQSTHKTLYTPAAIIEPSLSVTGDFNVNPP